MKPKLIPPPLAPKVPGRQKRKAAAKKQPGPVIPKGWRRLKAGEEIRSTDKFWLWNRGPWTRHGDTSSNSVGQFYRPFSTTDAAETHWLNIRRSPAGRKG